MGRKIEIIDIVQNLDKNGTGGVMVKFKVWSTSEERSLTRIATYRVNNWYQNLYTLSKTSGIIPESIRKELLRHLEDDFLITLFKLQGVRKKWLKQNLQKT
jgi:hypothetical protein